MTNFFYPVCSTLIGVYDGRRGNYDSVTHLFYIVCVQLRK